MQNRNSFLRWDSNFAAIDNIVTANDKAPITWENGNIYTIQILTGCFATFGIDIYSLEIVSITNRQYFPSSPKWSPGTLTLTIPRPTPNVTDFILKYRFKDITGKYSNTGTVNFTMVNGATGWLAKLDTSFCVLNSLSQRVGLEGWTTLHLVYTDDNSVVIPEVTKPNDPSDADYIAPVSNTATCPVNVSTAPYAIANMTDASGSYMTIVSVAFQKAGQSDIVITLNLTAGNNQTVYVPEDIYTLEVTYTTGGAAHTFSFTAYVGSGETTGTVGASPFSLNSTWVTNSYSCALVFNN